jgi:F0F1-type ATP synthase membrane subunit b/b'
MPQFDFFSFFVQIFWLTIGSFVFYLVYLKLIIKNSSEVIKMRQKINSFIVKAKENNNSSFLYNTVLDYFRSR